MFLRNRKHFFYIKNPIAIGNKPPAERHKTIQQLQNVNYEIKYFRNSNFSRNMVGLCCTFYFMEKSKKKLEYVTLVLHIINYSSLMMQFND